MKHKFDLYQNFIQEQIDHFVNDYSFCDKYFKEARAYVDSLSSQN